ncbi:RHS repeat-associated core domain-containing protein, partial [Leptospira interrogans]
NEAGALAYYLTDQVDSVSTVLDDEGNTLSQMQYLPYGDTFVQRGDLNFSPKFNSQELDRESGFYFYNARFYDPGIARFTSADTLIDGELDTQGWNRFSYVKGNPIGAKDPTGHEAIVDTLAGVNHVLNKLGDSSYKAGTASKDGSFVGNSVGLLHDSAGLVYKTAASLVPKNRKELEEAAVTGYGSQLAKTTAKGLAKVGDDIGKIPLGFKNSNQYKKAMSELDNIMKSKNISDYNIGVRGSSVTGQSFKTGKPFNAKSDIDVFVESADLTKGSKTSKNIPGFVHPETINGKNPEIGSWSERWGKILNRDISVGGFEKGKVPNQPTIFYGNNK